MKESEFNNINLDRLRKLFLKYLTVDSNLQDARRKEFNQAIFIAPSDKVLSGHQVFCNTDLDMVLEKFDKAVREFNNERE